nr:hypothetical protein [Abalone asfa-like virus]
MASGPSYLKGLAKKRIPIEKQPFGQKLSFWRWKSYSDEYDYPNHLELYRFLYKSLRRVLLKFDRCTYIINLYGNYTLAPEDLEFKFSIKGTQITLPHKVIDLFIPHCDQIIFRDQKSEPVNDGDPQLITNLFHKVVQPDDKVVYGQLANFITSAGKAWLDDYSLFLVGENQRNLMESLIKMIYKNHNYAPISHDDFPSLIYVGNMEDGSSSTGQFLTLQTNIMSDLLITTPFIDVFYTYWAKYTQQRKTIFYNNPISEWQTVARAIKDPTALQHFLESFQDIWAGAEIIGGSFPKV